MSGQSEQPKLIITHVLFCVARNALDGCPGTPPPGLTEAIAFFTRVTLTWVKAEQRVREQLDDYRKKFRILSIECFDDQDDVIHWEPIPETKFHSLVVGSTSSGKSSSVVAQILETVAKQGGKPFLGESGEESE